MHLKASLGSLGSAGAATLGFVFELLVLKEGLFVRGEYEHAVTFKTLQNLVDEFHGAFPRNGRTPRAPIGHNPAYIA